MLGRITPGRQESQTEPRHEVTEPVVSPIIRGRLAFRRVFGAECERVHHDGKTRPVNYRAGPSDQVQARTHGDAKATSVVGATDGQTKANVVTRIMTGILQVGLKQKPSREDPTRQAQGQIVAQGRTKMGMV